MLEFRRLVTIQEETVIEGGRPVEPHARVVAVAAVVKNPWAGQGFVDDLAPGIDDAAPALGELLTSRLMAAAGFPIEAYGKGAVVGLDGDIEHGSGLIHTLRFGDHLRHAVGGTSLLPAVEKRAPAGATFDIPLKHITDATTRSHHQTLEVRIGDAPRPDEIVVALAGSAGGRPHARLTPFSGS
jgi:hypothetical protein